VLRACQTCGAAYTPRTPRTRHCPTHEPRGRINRSPTTQAQDTEYRRNRATVLAGNPACAIRTHCDGAPATTIDHIVPVARGGSNALSNTQAACVSCNAAKGAR